MNRTPHDALFKAIFSNPARAMDEVRAVLPAQVVRHLDLTSAKLVPGSFVDGGLKQRHTDVLHTVTLAGREAFAYLLLEHQSDPDALMPYRLLRYMVRIWERWLEEHPGAARLPVILPLVVSHGPRGWTAARALSELYDLEARVLEDLRRSAPELEILVDDLSAQSDDALRGRAVDALVKLVVLALKHSRGGVELSRLVLGWSDLVTVVVEAPSGVAALGKVLRYVLMVDGDVDPEEFGRLLELSAGPRAKEAIVTTGERLIDKGRQEGRQEGLQEGRQEGMQRLLMRLLEQRFGASPPSVERRVNGADVATLERWTDRVLSAATLDAVFAD